ncbi:hypothetical protein GCM10009415_53090 [Chitinophaga japonensis]
MVTGMLIMPAHAVMRFMMRRAGHFHSCVIMATVPMIMPGRLTTFGSMRFMPVFVMFMMAVLVFHI